MEYMHYEIKIDYDSDSILRLTIVRLNQSAAMLFYEHEIMRHFPVLEYSPEKDVLWLTLKLETIEISRDVVGSFFNKLKNTMKLVVTTGYVVGNSIARVDLRKECIIKKQVE